MEGKESKIVTSTESDEGSDNSRKQVSAGRRDAVTKLAYASPVLASLLFSKNAAAFSPPPPPA